VSKECPNFREAHLVATFPIAILSPRVGIITTQHGDISLRVPIKPFHLALQDYDEPIEVQTSLELHCIDLPSSNLEELAEKTFCFPRNPEEGYIDGSIYIEHAHHPADVTRIKFGSMMEGQLPVEMDIELDFGFEGLGEYTKVAWLLSTTIGQGVV
jgi:hypothetical protein